MQSIRQYREIQQSIREQKRSSSCSSSDLFSRRSGSTVDEARFSATDEAGRTEKEARAYSKGDSRIVDWNGQDDRLAPRNWSMLAKVNVTAIVWINVFSVDWSAASNSQGNSVIAEYFGVSPQVELLSPALYVLGIALGSTFAGPVSETVGRSPVYIVSRIFHFFFVLGTCLAPNIQTQLVCRFLAGLGASTLLAVHGASIADIFGPYERSLAWPFVACGSFFGTVMSPIAGGWITKSASTGGLSWRWMDWISLILSAFTLIITALLLPETFAPILLKWKSAALRTTLADERFVSELDLQETFRKRLRAAFHRAWFMTTREPIVTLLGLWLVVLYAVIFGFLQGFTYLFKDTFSFSDGLKGTAFAGVVVGLSLYLAICPFIQYRYKRHLTAWKADPAKHGPLPPEYRLPPAFLVAVTFPISLFWLGWTNYSFISPWSDLGAITLFGFSWAGIYIACYLYILDVYGIYAGSALAAITFYRYGISAVMTIASQKMYMTMNTHWVCTFLGILACLLAPAPFLFYKYGPAIRERSRFAGDQSKAGAA